MTSTGMTEASSATATRHLVDIDDLSDEHLRTILDRALALARGAEPSIGARGRVLVNLFYEPSTRTRVSFEMAALRLGMEVVNVAAADSSVKKGESLLDTFSTLQAMAPDVVVVRHPRDDALESVRRACLPEVHLVNAGTGRRAHPTQALLDAVTLRSNFDDLAGLRVLLAGDLHHSRVARSGVALMRRLPVAEIRLCAPPGLEADDELAAGARVFTDLDQAISGVDVVMMLRIQRERLEGAVLPAERQYHRDWGLTPERLALAQAHCLVMHPGPMNRGVEIASSVADGPRSAILEQVANGVFTRMAVLEHLLGL
jgi:aspartate carbamoyltransferase catalytic subunit